MCRSRTMCGTSDWPSTRRVANDAVSWGQTLSVSCLAGHGSSPRKSTHERQHNQMALATWWRSTSWQEFQFPMLEHELKSSLFAFVALKVCLWRHGEKQSWSPTGSSNVPWRSPGRGEEESTVPSPWPLHPLVILFVLDKMMMMMMDVKSLWRTPETA